LEKEMGARIRSFEKAEPGDICAGAFSRVSWLMRKALERGGRGRCDVGKIFQLFPGRTLQGNTGTLRIDFGDERTGWTGHCEETERDLKGKLVARVDEG